MRLTWLHERMSSVCICRHVCCLCYLCLCLCLCSGVGPYPAPKSNNDGSCPCHWSHGGEYGKGVGCSPQIVFVSNSHLSSLTFFQLNKIARDHHSILPHRRRHHHQHIHQTKEASSNTLISYLSLHQQTQLNSQRERMVKTTRSSTALSSTTTTTKEKRKKKQLQGIIT